MSNFSSYEIPTDVNDDLNCRFTYHRPLDVQPERYSLIRGKGLELAKMLIRNTPPSREQSLALTKLEEAIFWANAAIARNEKEPNTETKKDA